MRLALTIALSTLLSVHAFAASLDTARGKVEITEAPKTVAVYDIGVLDTLDALGIQAAGIPENVKPQFLAEKQQGKTIGTLFEPNLEALASIQPEIIMIAARSAKQYDSVSRIAKTVDLTLENKNLYQETLNRLTQLGTIFHQEEQAKQWVEKLNQLKTEASEAAKGQGKVLAVLVNGPKLSLYGADSRLGWIQSTLGLQLIDKEKVGNAHGNPISFEFIAQSNPDWIFVIDRSAAIGGDLEAAQSVFNTPLVQNTKAGKSGRILYLSPAEIYIDIGGPQALEKTLIDIRDALRAHPAN
ncbi:siderophore ABC transporter substrate-binding protein [Suttonella ornithocola]|uniref:Uncharacterized ABC transporter solute-binding protein yclQ n=1 Tax=Suttonella ornithocola TaxID=279832 RepID=A0A380MKK6_9GAMM|nr:siderophore ABC transporter substrate-binding protein [Suttonella ornithocola]SUO93170.1 Uncharacterized ABC transporter solute-binding protein yclQ precursor [Suttonella ornithocola]